MFFTCLFQAIPPAKDGLGTPGSAPGPSDALRRVSKVPPSRPAPPSTPVGAVANLGSRGDTPPQDDATRQEKLEIGPLTLIFNLEP